ncbi:hypothetical protein OK349_04595 [Sphingomonas sp. BT-65]|uniref:hypothetical protein n=1 Tax=Sphingomonas sp. BT-65 TaxID=2989821 RepID=UPI002235BA0B|nr:hypothetical protein [Sphingomonas sp. BT-65]MCW4460975.1 hypothetical protein [Sphingomonas sp. BT-65]
MSARGARLRLAEIAHAAEAAGMAATRAGRFAARTEHRPAARVPLAELRRWPAWPGLEGGEIERFWRIAALVAARDALPEMIDGAALRAYAEPVGEAALEAVLDLPPGGAAPLAPAAKLTQQGRQVTERALPHALAAAMGLASAADAEAAGQIALAERIARRTRA